MVSGESPAVARRRLRLALRKAREAKGLTQGQVADGFDWSLSKVQRIESGDVTVSSTDLKALLARYEINDPKRVEQLVEVARASRRKGWWDEPRYRQHLTAATLQLLQFEGEASVIRVFDPTLLPGLVQTREYAEFILKHWSEELSEDDRAVRLEVRMRRRDHVLNRPDPPAYHLALDESVLYRQIGSAKIMLGQLQELLSLIRSRRIVARIVPFAQGAPLAMLNHFVMMDLGDEEDELLYREAQIQDEIVRAPEMVSLYRRRFNQLWEAALDEEATARLVEEKIAAMQRPPDPGGSNG